MGKRYKVFSKNGDFITSNTYSDEVVARFKMHKNLTLVEASPEWNQDWEDIANVLQNHADVPEGVDAAIDRLRQRIKEV